MRSVHVLSFALLVGCSSAANTTDAGPDAGSQDAPSTSTLTLWIYDAPVPNDTPGPLAGATVAFDPADGSPRIERTTDVDGRVSFDADFGAGGATVTAFAANHVLWTGFGLSPTSVAKMTKNDFGKSHGDLVVFLPRDAQGLAARTVKLSGTITNAVATGSNFSMSANGVGTIYDYANPSYSMRVPNGRAFTLLGSEYAFTTSGRSLAADVKKIWKLDEPSLTTDTTLDVDESAQTALSSSVVKTHLVLPGGAQGPFADSLAFVNVVDATASFYTGFATKSAPSADLTAMDCETTVTQIDTGTLPMITLARLTSPSNGVTSIAIAAGIVADGTTFGDLLLPPDVPSTIYLSQPLDLSKLPAGAEGAGLSVADLNGNLVWFAVLGSNGTIPASITMPALPTGATLPAAMRGQLGVSAGAFALSDGSVVPARRALSKATTVKK